MKKKDITLILVIVIISAVFSFFISGYLFGNPETEPQQAEVVEAITDEFISPDERYFNDESINPTQLIRVGDEEGNVSPFGSSN